LRHEKNPDHKIEVETLSMNANPGAPVKFLRQYWFGTALSAVLGSLVALLGLAASDSPGYGAIGLVLIALGAGVPLLVALLAVWAYYMFRNRGQVPIRLHFVMFAPVAIATLILPVSQEVSQSKQNEFDTKHPSIQEVHINLSGRDLWLSTGAYARTESGNSPSMPIRGGGGDGYVSFTRWPQRDEVEANDFPYDGGRLRSGLNTYSYASSQQDGSSSVGATVVPMTIFPYPYTRELSPYWSDSSALLYLYYHYPDHVEVTPALAPVAGGIVDFISTKVSGLMMFNISISTLYPSAIVRLEVDGQTLSLSSRGPIDRIEQCRYGYRGAGAALTDADRPLHIRWQTLREPGRWHEVRVVVPKLRALRSSGSREGWTNIILYFIDNDQVFAERFELLRSPDARLTVHATGVPQEVDLETICGGATDQFNADVIELDQAVQR
jgi:hypothetical protein